MVPFSEIVSDARRKIDADHAAQDREECRVMVLAHAPDFSAEDRAQMLAALMGGQPPASVNAERLEAVRGLVKALEAFMVKHPCDRVSSVCAGKPCLYDGGESAISAIISVWPQAGDPRAAISAARAAGGGA